MRFQHAIFAIFLAGGPHFLTGCQSPPIVYDVPGSRSYDRDNATIWPDLVNAIEAEGIKIAEADPTSGRLVAELIDYQPKGWAACKPARVIDRHDDKNRRDRGRPVDRQLRLTVQLADTGAGSVVDMQTSFSERQINPFKNLPFQVRCPSTGELERALFAALDNA